MVTLKEIAQKCNVSIATVSNILNGKSNVSKRTKERVLKIIEETGYKPNFMARSLRATNSRTIGMIVDDITAFGTSKIIEGIMEICEEFNYRSIMSNLRIYSKWLNKEHTHQDFVDLVHAAIDEMLALKVDGIIYVGAYSREVDYLPLDLPIPIVIAYSFSKDKSVPAVFIDDVKSAYDMTEYLITMGHKNIAIITGQKGIHTELRIQGCKQAFIDNSIEYNEENIVSSSWEFSGGYNACTQLNLAQKVRDKKITALFCFNDLIAAGAYTYFEENNLIPGKDISIAGFDNRDIAECLHPLLTTMEIRIYDIGQKSAEMLINLIKNSRPEQNDIQISSLLCKRDSVVKLNK